MKRKIILTGSLILSALFFAACGMLGGGSNSISVKTENGMSKTFEVKDGKFATVKGSRVSGDVTEQLVCLADYEMQLPENPKSYDLEKEVGENQTKVCFDINGQEGFNENAEIKTGTYEMASFSGGYKPDRVGLSPTVYYFKDGKAEKQSLKSNGTKGKVEITSASADQISGTIDLTDEKNDIKGGFTAQRAKKK